MRSRYRGLSMPRLVFAGLVSAALMLLATGTETGAQGYDYPFINAFEATVIGTPSIYAAELPDRIPTQEAGLMLFPERPTPDIFWYDDQLRYSVVLQPKKAPLIFNIAGTGASHGFVTNSIAARITPNGSYRQAVIQAAVRHAVKA